MPRMEIFRAGEFPSRQQRRCTSRTAAVSVSPARKRWEG